MTTPKEGVYQVTNLIEAKKALSGVKHIHVHLRLNGYIKGDEEHYKPGYYSAGLESTRKAVMAWLTDNFKYAPKSDTIYLTIKVTTHEGYMTRNKRTGAYDQPKPYKSAWIG